MLNFGLYMFSLHRKYIVKTKIRIKHQKKNLSPSNSKKIIICICTAQQTKTYVSVIAYNVSNEVNSVWNLYKKYLNPVV